LSSPPAIDGRIDSTEWAAAVPLTGFRGDWQSDTLSVPIQAAVGRDDSGMFIYLKCRLPAGDAPEPVVRLQDDPALDRDRRLECTFSLPGEAASPVVFAITSLGVKEDRMGPDAGWDPSWSAATRLVPGEWSAECSIPFSALGIDRPEALRLLRFNVALVDGSKPVDRWSWSVTYGGPADPSRFGDLLLAQAPSPQDRPE
jgi:hypothetical protein